jgi:hypothetical protein
MYHIFTEFMVFLLPDHRILQDAWLIILKPLQNSGFLRPKISCLHLILKCRFTSVLHKGIGTHFIKVSTSFFDDTFLLQLVNPANYRKFTSQYPSE